MDAPDSDDIAAMLKHEGVDYASLPRATTDGNPRNLLKGAADAMIAYTTNEPIVFEKLGTPYLTFSPRAFGFDFYGDNLCTSKEQVAKYPERVRAFRSASLKGWKYALAHKEEIVDLILRRYSTQKTREALLFEAKQTELLIQPRLVPIGDQTIERWTSIANTYVSLGMMSESALPADMIYLTAHQDMVDWLKSWPLAWLLLASCIVCALGWLLYRRRERALGALGLNTVMSGLFVLLSIPVLIFILLYNYHQNAAAIKASLRDQVAKTKQTSIEYAQNLIDPVAATLSLLAATAADNPGKPAQGSAVDLAGLTDLQLLQEYVRRCWYRTT